MKILIVGDLHFRLNLPYSNLFDDGRKQEWADVKSTIQALSFSCDHVVFVGDIFNLRHNNSSVIKECVEFFQGIGKQAELHILAGNHDRYGKHTAIDFLQKIDKEKWNVYTHPTNTKIGDKFFTFLPFMTPGLLEVTDLTEANETIYKTMAGGDYLFHHHAVTSTKSGGSDVTTWPEIVLKKERVESIYKKIFGGHIHTPQELSEKTWVTGNIFTNEAGDLMKEVFLLDTDTNKITEVPLPVRGIYVVFEKDIKKLYKIPDKSIVKLVVSKRTEETDEIVTRFDASIIVEKRDDQREKIKIQEAGGLDLSMENLLKLYSEARNIPHEKLKEAVELLEDYEQSTRT